LTTNPGSSTTITTPSDREITVTRVFNAPRKLVWKVWTQAEHLTRWWGPQGWTLPVCKMDFRVSGVWHYCMKGPDGEESCGMAVYHEIVEPERFVYTDYFADADGNPVEGMPETLVTVEFTSVDDKTKITSTMLFQTAEDRDQVLKMGMEEGLKETWDRLEEYLTNV
jgi:uncharacterized protein YndB with AHSA1/START domain